MLEARIIEDELINRRSLYHGHPTVINELRHRLKKRGFDVTRRLAVDVSQRSLLIFRYASSIVTPFTVNFSLVPRRLTDAEKLAHNRQEFLAKRDKGTYYKPGDDNVQKTVIPT